jgi:hypothetical protein
MWVSETHALPLGYTPRCTDYFTQWEPLSKSIVYLFLLFA